jgi:hypothetical protein
MQNDESIANAKRRRESELQCEPAELHVLDAGCRVAAVGCRGLRSLQ